MLRTLSKIPGLHGLLVAFYFLFPPNLARAEIPKNDDPYAHIYPFLLVEIRDIPYKQDSDKSDGLTLLFDE